MNKESEIRELICKYNIDIENEHEFIEELKGICGNTGTVIKPRCETIYSEGYFKPKKRYFIVFGNGGRSTACFHITTDGGYVTLEDIDKAYSEQFPGNKGVILVPSNVIELNKSDYKDWTKENKS